MTIDNATQIEFWNGETGHNWVTHDALMEAMLQPLGESVMDTLAPQPGEHVLDIGCGCGHTSLSLAERVGACLLYTSPSPRDATLSRMPSSA